MVGFPRASHAGSAETDAPPMIIRPGPIFATLWIAWVVSWLAAAFWSSRTAKRVVTWDVWAYRIAVVAGIVLLSHFTARRFAVPRLWHVGYGGGYALAGLAALGFAFAWWARIQLGPLWSGAVARKDDHRVVDTGPYAWVRHPIYTGLILATFATAAAQATLSGLTGAALIACGLWLKARVEERFLTAELGEEAYGAYRRRVPMLVPLIGAGNR